MSSILSSIREAFLRYSLDLIDILAEHYSNGIDVALTAIFFPKHSFAFVRSTL